MKILNLLPLLFLSAIVAAQTPVKYPEAPGVTVIKSSWHTKIHDPLVDQDPLGPSGEHLQSEIFRQDQNQSGGARFPGAPPPTVWRNPKKKGSPSLGYFFEATIRNSGEKKIRRIAWEYVFSNVDGSRMGYRAFVNEVNLSPGKNTKMIGYIKQGARNVADAKEAEKAAEKLRGKYVELISIRRIEYEDGSMWKRPSS